MHSERSYRIFVILLLLVLSILDIWSFCPKANGDSSAGRTLTWSVIKTPSEGPANVIRSNSEINSMALGNGIFYCADTANSKLFRSIDGGYSFTDISASLTAAGAKLPVWPVAVAPDDPQFVVAVTDWHSPPLGPSGPRQIYASIDGGDNWQNAAIPPTGLPGPGNNGIGNDEYISCIDISKQYNNTLRDIAIGTRTTTGLGQVLNHQYGTIGTPWQSQGIAPAAITSLKFSPGYPSDVTLVAISCNAASTVLNFGERYTTLNSTSWNTPYSPSPSLIPYPITIANVTAGQVIGTDLSLPSDFNGHISGFAGCFASIQSGAPFTDPKGRSTLTGVFYINTLFDTALFTITPRNVVSSGRIYSIAYNGGILLAGEATANPAVGMVTVYQSLNAQSSSADAVTWTSSQDYDEGYKSPTGGGNSGRANAILAWQNGVPYCGTSSENDTIGGTAWAPGQWPRSKLTGVALDESAFSYSFSGQAINCQTQWNLSGLGWNQIGLIDTEISQLSDSAALEPPANTAQSLSTTTCTPQAVLYLSSLNKNTTGITYNFDSVWRSTIVNVGNMLGDRWERVLTDASSDNGLIIRINTKAAGTTTALIVGDLTTPVILYSNDQGQTWKKVLAGILSLRDLTFEDEGVIYVLEDYRVRQLNRGGDNTTWVPEIFVNTDLPMPGHSICVPLTNPQNSDMVFIGTGVDTAGKPEAYVAWTDFSLLTPQFTALKMLPQTGNVHIIADTEFDQNNMIYVGISSDVTPSSEGAIYRWTIGQSTDWDELEPPDLAFFGIAMAGDVLYGAFNFNATTLFNSGGVDRTLSPKIKVPPAPDWDQLIDGLPVSGDANFPVAFTHEPTSLKVSSNTNNTLWAIDNSDYVFDNKTGCLWQYIDSAARASPWPTAPASGSFIGADPVTGRSQQIDIKWRPLQDIFGYDILMAKDVNFTLLLTQNINMFPVDNKTGAWVVTLDQSQQLSPGVWIPPGVLEAGKSYYWEVRGSRTITGAAIHSLWSPVMFFSVKPGFAVRGIGNGPQLLTPIDGMCQDCQPTIGFSWTPVKNAKKYEFTLANDQDLKNILVQTVTTTTAYKYEGKLEPGRIYFWRVKAVAPFESDPSPTGTFVIAGSRPLISWPSLPPSYLWIVVIIAAAVLVVLIVALFIYNYMRRY